MPAIIRRFIRLFRPAHPIPDAYRPIFTHLFLDMAWFGVLSGTIVAFLAVYATRMGASDAQIGYLSAAPALVNLLFALPAGSWLSRSRVGRAVFWSSVLQRVFYLGLVPLPLLFLPHTQVWVILLMTLLMNIPGTAMVVGFNSQFGEVVPLEWRGYVAGTRNALLSVISTVFTLISGWILSHMAFPTGYQVVFFIGILGAGMSSLHLYRLSSIVASVQGKGNSFAQPRTASGRKLALELHALYQRGVQSLRLDAMHGQFARIMALLFCWHLAQFLTIPIITPYVVNQLHLSDQLIGLAGGLFNMAVFTGSLGLSRIVSRFGNKKLMGIGVMVVSLFPFLTSTGAVGYFLANLLGGLGWSMAGGVLFNYILDYTPADDRPAHLAWYNLISNGAILIGSLCGPAIAGIIGPVTALILFGIGRFLAGAAILRWG
jgi:MFS family permease